MPNCQGLKGFAGTAGPVGVRGLPVSMTLLASQNITVPATLHLFNEIKIIPDPIWQPRAMRLTFILCLFFLVYVRASLDLLAPLEPL